MGAKRVETRSWSTAYRGPMAIHAAQKKLTRDLEWSMSGRATEAMIEALGVADFNTLPRGAILAVANLVNVVKIDEQTRKYWGGELRTSGTVRGRELLFGDWTDGEDGQGRYAWIFDETVVPFEAVACSGRQGLWTVPSDVSARLPEWARA